MMTLGGRDRVSANIDTKRKVFWTGRGRRYLRAGDVPEENGARQGAPHRSVQFQSLLDGA